MSGLQTVLMLHSRKEPVLYTQHSAMMLHDALIYEKKIEKCSTYWRESCRRKPYADHTGGEWIGKQLKQDFDDKYIKNPWVYHLLRKTTVEYTIWPVNDTYIIDGLLSSENYGKTDDFYFIKQLLSRAWVRMISTYFEWWSGVCCSCRTIKDKKEMDDIYSFNKTHAPVPFDSIMQHLEKTSYWAIRGSII